MEHISKEINERKIKGIPAVSRVFDNGEILELLYQPDTAKTLFCIWDGKTSREVHECKLPSGMKLIPYSPGNNLIEHNVILFPSGIEEYGTQKKLIDDIRTFIHRYVDLSEEFEVIAAYYVLFTWIYDQFNELPYLRVRGDYGCGKTRFLLTIGSLCYKPIFASGASTVSPIFHILDAFRGTLIVDEADFRFSDEKADIVKILNNGNARGFPILRSEQSKTKEFNPRAFNVYGPKLVATRGFYEDKALESRFITDEIGGRKLRSDIPINMPSSYLDEARILRNKLLLFRFHNLGKINIAKAVIDRGIEPRLNQIFSPLLSVVDDSAVREQLQSMARGYNQDIQVDRGMDTEALVLESIIHLMNKPDSTHISIKDITQRFIEQSGSEYEKRITTKWIGHIIRKQLKLTTKKSKGIYIIPPEELPKITHLCTRYNVEMKRDTASEGTL